MAERMGDPSTQSYWKMKTVTNVKKIAFTSDYAKIYESILQGWRGEDIGAKINTNQFAGKKGVGTEHML